MLSEDLSPFEAVGCERIKVSVVDEAENPRIYWEKSLAESIVDLKIILPEVEAEGCTIRGRPVNSAVKFLQFDDLSPELMDRLAPLSFRIVETSPDNRQVWLAVKTGERNLRRRVNEFLGIRYLAKKEYDKNATGAGRLAGALNNKPNRRLPDGSCWRVQLVQADPDRVLTIEDLVDNGLLAAPESKPKPKRSARSGEFPDYESGLENARTRNDGSGPNISDLDFAWCCACARRGIPIEETIENLLQESPKARKRERKYAEDTVRNAYAEVAREARAVA